MPRITERPDWPAIATCFLIAIAEGFDIQSMGVAAPRLAPALGLGPNQMGLILSSSILGLAVGAAFGGPASDRYGRRRVLTVAMALLGIFSLATAYTDSFGTFIFVRVLAGLGLGGVFPSLIWLATEAAPPKSRTTILGIVYCGLPVGGALAGAVASVTTLDNWSTIFLVGGCGPLMLIPLIASYVPRSAILIGAQAESLSTSQPSKVPFEFTVLLWLAFFFTLMTVYTLLNWLPSLMVAKGLSRYAAAQSSIFLNIGAAVGSLLLGRIADRTEVAKMIVAIYIGMGIALACLILASGPALQLAALVVGFFVIGGQLILYSLPPLLYPRTESGKGIGAAIAVGRIGSILGPITAGFILSSDLGPNAVAFFAEIGLAIALTVALRLSLRARLGKCA